MAHLVPQYDAYGIDSGLWILYDEQYDGIAEAMYECLGLYRSNGTLKVWQCPDWDNETYDDCGYALTPWVFLGELDCENPYMNEDAANKLYNWLLENDKAVSL